MTLAAVSGCASKPPPHAAVVVHDPTSFERSRAPGNLALGPGPEVNLLAEQFAGRLAAPGAYVGYRLGEMAFSSVFTYDDQSFYDRLGGAYFQEADSFRLQSWLR
jgi:hypothetical protein